MSLQNQTTDQQYSIVGNNPIKNFSGNEEKSTYSKEEIELFYFAHHPEKNEIAEWSDVTKFYKEIGSTLQLATSAEN